jgi:hypothetical protein
VTNASFFSNLKRKNQKRTFINVLFPKIQNTFEKNDSLHSLRRPPSLSCRRGFVTIMLRRGDERGGHVATIMLRMIADDRVADAPILL